MRAAAPVAFHVMAKPTGAVCNLSCDYCFFLKKARLYPRSRFRMSEEVLESYIRQTIEAHRVPEVTIAWQGGEPTLMGLSFFRRAVELQERHRRPGVKIQNTLQTNGLLLDEEWCAFLREQRFLVGLSLDGPAELNDAYRRDKAGRSVFDQVVRGGRLLQSFEVDYNILCTVNAHNARRPLDVYRFFRDELGARYLQLIPIVERDNANGDQTGTRVTERTVPSVAYGQFLIEIFDEWVRRDVGKMFVLTFDGTLAAWLRGESSLCVFRPTCGDGVALEHNGDLYSCDHFVESRYFLGNILQTPLVELVGSAKQRRFGQAKSAALPSCCRRCQYLFACHGECPKNRVLSSEKSERGLSWLCAGLKAYFRHVDEPMQLMAALLRQGRAAPEVMRLLAARERRPAAGAPS